MSLPLFLRPGSAIILSGGAPVDFYFDESGAWRLKELYETKVEERAWKSDGEWRARGAEYDYTSRVTVVVNFSLPPATVRGISLSLHVPNSRDGGYSAGIGVSGTNGGKVRVEVMVGKLRGEWRVVRVGRDTGVVQGVANDGQKWLEV